MTQTEALKLALVALERGETELRWKALAAIKEALAQPEQSTPKWQGVRFDSALHDSQLMSQHKQEPVAWIWKDGTVTTDSDRADGTWTPLYTDPLQRTWQGLTDEERRGIREWQEIQKELGPVWAPMMLYLYEAIEAKLREKNT